MLNFFKVRRPHDQVLVDLLQNGGMRLTGKQYQGTLLYFKRTQKIREVVDIHTNRHNDWTINKKKPYILDQRMKNYGYFKIL